MDTYTVTIDDVEVEIGISEIDFLEVTAMGGVPGPPGISGYLPVPLSFPTDPLHVGLGVQPFPVARDMTILRIMPACDPNKRPNGSPIIFDVRIGDDSVFTVTPKPTILSGENIGVSVVPDITVVPAGSVLYGDILAVGSVYAGANATLIIEMA